MEKVSILEASRRLRIPTSLIRECVRKGELIAERVTTPDARTSWVIVLPEDGWESSVTAVEKERPFSPWWWGNSERAGNIHYVQDIFVNSVEEIVPRFLCGYDGRNIWSVATLRQELLCLDCLDQVEKRGLPLSF